MVANSDCSGANDAIDDVACRRILGHWSRAFSAVQVDRAQWKQFESIVPRWSGSDSVLLDKDSFLGLLRSREDSGPGPDGLPYSAWKALPELEDELWCWRQELCETPEFDDSELTSLMVFLIKSFEEREDGPHLTTPANLRPLQMSNTCLKICLAYLGGFFDKVASELVVPFQRGGVRGRRLQENVIGAESSLIQWIMRGEPYPAMICFDVLAAFPSLDHGWILFALQIQAVPMILRRLIVALYRVNIALFRWRRSRWASMALGRGVGQDCPLSGVVWTLSESASCFTQIEVDSG